MFKRVSLIFVSIFFRISWLSGQVVTEKPFEFTGIVLDQDSMKPIQNVQIHINNEILIISKENGQFNFSAKANDTIKINFSGLNKIEFIVPDSLVSGNNLLGIFMAKDSINFKNIIIYPKKTDYDLRVMMLSNQHKDQQTINAENNLKSISFQGKTNNNLEMDATDMQKIVLRKYDSKVEYKYMISPDNMISFNGIYKYVNQKIQENNTKGNNDELTKKEEKILIELFLYNKNQELSK